MCELNVCELNVCVCVCVCIFSRRLTLPQCPMQAGAELAKASPKGVGGVEIEPVSSQTTAQVCVCSRERERERERERG